MNGDPTDPRHEIVIIRRKSGGGDDGHHGGAWKIAYADFVTAMMAFFLVMWLINASNEATRAQVASYFNPIKLTDSSTSKRGLNEPKETLKKKEDRANSQPGPSPDGSAKASDVAMSQEDKLMHDPMVILKSLEAKDSAAGHVKIVEGMAASDNAEQLVEGGNHSAVGIPSGSSNTVDVSDPFDPGAWQESEGLPTTTQRAREALADSRAVKHGAAIEEKQKSAPVTTAELQPATKESGASFAAPKSQTEEKDSTSDGRPPAVIEANNSVSETEVENRVKPTPQEQLAKEANEIRSKILEMMGAGTQPLPANVEVEATAEGMLISLTDKYEFGMFALGSAEPSPRLVTLARAISEALKDRPGYVVVRGHTDSKPYHNKKYDNWQLSTARAHMASYMLVTGGLDESRIRRIEGYADRDPKNAVDPQAPENRRIEILVEGFAQ